ncbi:hypothetical protein ACHAWF_015005 [Thalassiosira exigua]
MRRRQAGAGGGDDLGIVILQASDVRKGDKYDRRQRRNNAHLLVGLGTLAAFAIIVVGALALASTSKNGMMASNSTDVAVVDGRNNSTGHLKAQSTIGMGDSNAQPVHKGTDGPPRIPRRLVFTYKYNLIKPTRDEPPFNAKQPLTANVLHTIEMYQRHWEAEDARSEGEVPTEEVVVSFLSDDDCVGAIRDAEPRLVPHFRDEDRGEFKADICRIAELYLRGGYYFDIDIGAIEPVDLSALPIPTAFPDPMWQLDAAKKGRLGTPGDDDVVTFVTVMNRQGRFFQAFLAAAPRQPVLKRALGYMVAYYEGTLERVLPDDEIRDMVRRKGRVPSRDKPSGMGVGPFTLAVSHRLTTDEEWEEYVGTVAEDRGRRGRDVPLMKRYSRFLYEISLEDSQLTKLGLFRDVPLQDANYTKKVSWCNYVCFGGRKVYFYSRVPGSKGCPEEKRLSPPYH